MSGLLDKLAETCGIDAEFDTEFGDVHRVSDRAKRGALEAMGFAATGEEAIRDALTAVEPVPPAPDRIGTACYMPDWLRDGRCWGVTAQVYALRSDRDQGIGDFEDLARAAEIAAGWGADFFGVNPLHALFTAEPRHLSPFSPSSRRFLNPIYIALDRVDGFLPEMLDPHELEAARAPGLVDHMAVMRLKLAALRRLFEAAGSPDALEGDAALERFATFEALSHAMVSQGHAQGWKSWPDAYHDVTAGPVAAFAREHRGDVLFHAWMQRLAARQLGEAQDRARSAGMRIGLYLDLAVGTAPDGADAWADPEMTVPGARAGAPPGTFNEAGQDWGLAPLSPAALVAHGTGAYEAMLRASMDVAGAVRVDHVMGLQRLYWVSGDADATDGAYVRYPMEAMVAALAKASQETGTIVVGEDLGTVPEGFRERMAEAEVQSYRVLFFERGEMGSFLAPDAYPREALACVSTHDLATLRGWWEARDIDMRAENGLPGGDEPERRKRERFDDRRGLLYSLEREGLLPQSLDPAAPPDALPDAVAVAAHRYLARAPSRLVAVQLDDMLGSPEQINVPGTTDEQPNWRRRLPATLEEIEDHPLAQAIVEAMRVERGR